MWFRILQDVLLVVLFLIVVFLALKIELVVRDRVSDKVCDVGNA